MPKLTVADIFAGCGGSSLGFKQAGFKHLWGIDHEKSACATYEANIGKVICADVGSMDWLSLERPDVLIGSPPCQGFSVAGKREKDDPRNILVWGFVWAVAIFKPKAFLIENVPGVGQGDWAQFPSIVKMALETLGYNVSVFKLNAADYGVPQIRKRVFWAGCLGEYARTLPNPKWIQIPEPTHSEGGTMGLKPWVTVRQALEIPIDSPCPSRRASANASSESERIFWEQAGNDKGTNPLRMSTQRSKGKCHTPESDVEGRPSLTLSGEAPSIGFYRHPCDNHRQSIYSLDDVSPAIRTVNRPNPDRTSGYRRLTVEECLILQGFPKTYELVGNQTERYKQVGNAVPPPVAEALAQAVKRAINE